MLQSALNAIRRFSGRAEEAIGVAPQTQPLQKSLMITVDVEALPYRQSEKHVERLIWGRFGENEAGIASMCDALERHNSAGVFYLDYCEEYLYGDEILEVGRYLHGRGHDVQVHTHPELLGADFWKSRGLALPSEVGLGKAFPMNECPEAHLEAIFDYVGELHLRVTGVAPTAFRGGGLRYSRAVLDSMHRRGFKFSSNYCVDIPHQKGNDRVRPIFEWSNGLVEIPISGFHDESGYQIFNFNSAHFQGHQRTSTSLKRIFGDEATGPIGVALLHSRSFCHTNPENRHFEFRGNKYKKNFDEMLRAVNEAGIKIVDTRQLTPILKNITLTKEPLTILN